MIIGARRKGIKLLPVLDAVAPGGLWPRHSAAGATGSTRSSSASPPDLPWALEVSGGTAAAAGYPPGTTYHPTFLYESLWCLAGFALLVWADRRFQLGHGRVVALYVTSTRSGAAGSNTSASTTSADHVLGLRFNVWTSIVVFLAGLAWFVWSARRHPGREQIVSDRVVA